jgi:hypothetical protein
VGRGAKGGGKIPGARSVQRGPEMSVKCSHRLSSFMFALNEVRLLAHCPLIDRKTYLNVT